MMPSRVEKRATSASSMLTSAASGRGSAMRASPSRLSSKPLPIWIATTATPSTSANELNETPAANQNVPRSGGK